MITRYLTLYTYIYVSNDNNDRSNDNHWRGLHVRPIRLLRVWVSEGLTKQALNSKGWEFSCTYNFIGGLPESLAQGLLVGKLLVGGLGVFTFLFYKKEI